MTTSQPKPSSRPLNSTKPTISDDEKLKRAEEVNNKPSMDVAKDVGLVNTSPATPDAQPVEQSNQYPWLNAGKGLQSINFKMPMEMFLKVKWLSDTEYGMNMSKLYNLAIEKEVNERMKARGIIQE